jgi:uncharacterized phage-associated protein
MDNIQSLSGWICKNYQYKDSLTHLKLQKLFFYCYGALQSNDLEKEIGSDVIFEPWHHGPVNRNLYQIFKNKKSNPITFEDCNVTAEFDDKVSKVLMDTLIIYGAMSAWSLREQTHTEKPWKIAYEKQLSEIDYDLGSLAASVKKVFSEFQKA